MENNIPLNVIDLEFFKREIIDLKEKLEIAYKAINARDTIIDNLEECIKNYTGFKSHELP